MSRIGAREKFRWRGWEFRLSRADSKEAHWFMKQENFEVRVIYRASWISPAEPSPEAQDLEVPAEWVAIIRMHGVAAEAGVGDTVELALAAAEHNFRSKVVSAARVYSELKRGKQPDPEG